MRPLVACGGRRSSGRLDEGRRAAAEWARAGVAGAGMQVAAGRRRPQGGRVAGWGNGSEEGAKGLGLWAEGDGVVGLREFMGQILDSILKL